jgi:hypothetical protein
LAALLNNLKDSARHSALSLGSREYSARRRFSSAYNISLGRNVQARKADLVYDDIARLTKCPTLSLKSLAECINLPI